MTPEELKNITVEKQDDSTVKITGEIPYTYLEKHRAAAIAFIGKDAEIPGFRKGNIPEKMLIERVGEASVIAEMAERALQKVYPLIVKEHNLEVIGYPEIAITKIAKDNPLGFTATVAVYPTITLPDYKAIAKDINGRKESYDVTDEEVETQVKDILRQKTAYERLQKKAASGEPETHTHADGTVHEGPAHDEHGHTHHDEHEEEIPLPELTDDYVKTLGQPGQFESVLDFKAKIREHLAIEKRQEVDSKHRASITDAVIEKSTMVLPKVMVTAEINQMFAQMEEDLKRAQLSMEDYLGHIKKTREDLEKEWAPSAEKRAKLQLVLNEMAKQENITPDAGLVDAQVSELLARYKDADETRVRVYVASILTNDAVMKMLEEVK